MTRKVDNSVFAPPSPESLPRPLVIDGCNIGRSASGIARTHVDCAGLVAVVRWLLNKNFDVTVFLPVVYNNVNNYNTKNAELLHKLESLGIVTFTPARSGRGLRKAFINYDDLYVVSYATRHGGCIMSGDKFKDILHQSCYNDFHDVIRNRTIDIRFRPLAFDYIKTNEDMFYRNVPELFIYDNTTSKYRTIKEKLFVEPQDEDYHLVRAHNRIITNERRTFLCNQLDSLLYSMSFSSGRVFRDIGNNELPFVESFHCNEKRIEHIFKESDKFYQLYNRHERKCDSTAPFVMQPVIDTKRLKDTNIKKNAPKVAKLIEIDDTCAHACNVEIDDQDERIYAMNGNNKQLVYHGIHPDLIDIDLSINDNEGYGRFPENLTSSALLEWFSKVHEMES